MDILSSLQSIRRSKLRLKRSQCDSHSTTSSPCSPLMTLPINLALKLLHSCTRIFRSVPSSPLPSTLMWSWLRAMPPDICRTENSISNQITIVFFLLCFALLCIDASEAEDTRRPLLCSLSSRYQPTGILIPSQHRITPIFQFTPFTQFWKSF